MWIVREWILSLLDLKETKANCAMCDVEMDEPNGLFKRSVVYTAYLCVDCTKKVYDIVAHTTIEGPLVK